VSDAVEEMRTEYMRLDVLQRAPRNPKGHDKHGIRDSINRHGYVETPILDDRTGRLIGGHGRLDDLEDRKRRGEAPPRRIKTDDDGEWLVPVSRGYASANDDEAEALLVALNRLPESGGWELKGLADILDNLRTSDFGLVGTGYSATFLDELHAQFERDEIKIDPIQATKGAKQLAKLDLIYTVGSYMKKRINPFTAAHPLVHCCMAVRSGWSYGVRSQLEVACSSAHTWEDHRPIFVDNHYVDYQHEEHLAAVEFWKPRYCTVRDAMTPEQCEVAGIAYYPLEQILEWGDQLLEAGAENVMVIPKYQCLDEIPERFMLGYSVPSSYGATPLPIARFAGRKTHLLGGSIQMQLRYWRELQDDVVSLDNNQILRLAMFGGLFGKDGNPGTLSDYNVNQGDATSHMYISLALSLGFAATWFGHEGRDELNEVAIHEEDR